MFEYEKFTLNNGIKVLLAPLKTTRIVSVNVLVKTGSRYERKNNNGITHFIEHLLFKGTDRRTDALVISKEIDNMGADMNGSTGQEYSHFYVKLLDEHFEKAVDILSDILSCSKFEQKHIETERTAILEEIKMRKDHPSIYVWEIFNRLLYGDQPLGFDIAGNERVLNKISRSEMFEHFRESFIGSNIIISLAGNIDVKSALGLVNRYFGGFESGCSAEFLPVHESQTSQAVELRYQKTEQTHLCIGNRAYNYEHPDYYALALMNLIVGGNMSSRLFTILREEKGLVYSVGALNQSFFDTGNFVVHAGAGHGNIEETIRIILGEFRKLKGEDVKTEELERAKNAVTGYLYMSLDSSSGIAGYIGGQELRLGRILTPEERLGLIKKVTAQDIRRVANDILKDETLNLALIGPFKDKEKFEKMLTTRTVNT